MSIWFAKTGTMRDTITIEIAGTKKLRKTGKRSQKPRSTLCFFFALFSLSMTPFFFYSRILGTRLLCCCADRPKPAVTGSWWPVGQR